jgi:opacity protein-like surface antigen
MFVLTVQSEAGDMFIRAKSDIVRTNKATQGFYAGLGLGKMQLDDDYTEEFFRTYPIMFQLGYGINQYLAIEARYTRSKKVSYDGGKTPNPDTNDFPTTFTNLSTYLKLMYPYKEISSYILLGYGQTMLTDIKGSDRTEEGFQWGVGAIYRVTENVGIFADYTSLYNGKGFDGRAKNRSVNADSVMIGVTYAF